MLLIKHKIIRGFLLSFGLLLVNNPQLRGMEKEEKAITFSQFLTNSYAQVGRKTWLARNGIVELRNKELGDLDGLLQSAKSAGIPVCSLDVSRNRFSEFPSTIMQFVNLDRLYQ